MSYERPNRVLHGGARRVQINWTNMGIRKKENEERDEDNIPKHVDCEAFNVHRKRKLRTRVSRSRRGIEPERKEGWTQKRDAKGNKPDCAGRDRL